MTDQDYDRLRARVEVACESRLLLRWGSAACDDPLPGHDRHSQSASGHAWTDADAEQSVRDREGL